MNLCTLVLLAALPAGTPGEDIAAKIVQAGHTKVGVIPSVISRKGDEEATVGSLGPRAATLAKDVQNQLVALSTSGKYRGKFSVVSERVMRNALNEVAKNRPLAVDDLGNPKALKAIADYTGAKGFITLGVDETDEVAVVDDDGKKEKVDTDVDKIKKQDLADLDTGKIEKRENAQKIEASYTNDEGDEFHNETYRDVNTFSKAAYMGDSFELRRWEGDTLLNLGIETDHPQFAEDSHWEFGLGEKWEKEQFQYLKSSYEHPLDVDGFPFEIEIVVDDTVRKPKKVRGKYLVELNPGEEYAVYIKNGADQPVAVALYVDGVNSIDKQRREPDALESGRHWSLPKDYTMNVAGWYTIDSKLKTQQANKFEIVERDQSVAAQKGFEENIGMITAIFYANDAVTGKYVDYPKDSLLDNLRSVFGESQFGTGSGEEFDEKLEFATVQRGLMLAAVTIYYRSEGEIESILAGKSDDFVLGDSELAKVDLDDEDDGDKNEKKKPSEDDDDDKEKSKAKKDDEELKFD